MYFLDAKGVPTPLTFRIHHFGPYSSELDYQTDNLELLGAIKLANNANSFVITPGEKAQAIVDNDSEYISQYGALIDQVLEVLPNEPRVLELWSTTHFVANSLNQFYGGASKENVVRDVKRIKQEKFRDEEIQEAYDKVVELGFLS